eukprot:g2574.t1
MSGVYHPRWIDRGPLTPAAPSLPTNEDPEDVSRSIFVMAAFSFPRAAGSGDAAFLTSDPASPSAAGCRVSLFFHAYGADLGGNDHGGPDPTCGRGIPQGKQVVQTQNDENYVVLGSRSLKGSSRSITFSVQAVSDAHVAFFPDFSNQITCTKGCGAAMPVYEIVIGGWGNTRSVIRRSMGGSEQATASTVGILDPAEASDFWADALNGLVRFGTGSVVGSNVVLQWQDPAPLTMRVVGVMTGWGATGEWVTRIRTDEWAICCDSQCGTCGGGGCGNDGTLCCAGNVRDNFHRSCDLFPPPCVRGTMMFDAGASLAGKPETSKEATLELLAAPAASGSFTRIPTTLRFGQHQTSPDEHWKLLSAEVPVDTTRLQVKATRGFGARSDLAIDFISFQGCGENEEEAASTRLGAPDDHAFCESNRILG